jgi:hypothetical protein
VPAIDNLLLFRLAQIVRDWPSGTGESAFSAMSRCRRSATKTFFHGFSISCPMSRPESTLIAGLGQATLKGDQGRKPATWPNWPTAVSAGQGQTLDL